MKPPVRNLLLLIAMACTTGTAADRNVIGRWRSLETSKGGIGGMFIFREDGTLEFSPGAVVETEYRVEGNRLIMPGGTVNGPEQVWVIESLTKNELRLSQEESQSKEAKTPGAPASAPSMRMTREGEVVDPRKLILGTWQSRAAWQSPSSDKVSGRSAPIIKSTWQFRADGLVLLTVPFRIEKGRYSIKDDLIRIEIEARPTVEGKVRWEGDVLVVPGPRGSGESRFARY
jgi:hypothetical protein